MPRTKQKVATTGGTARVGQRRKAALDVNDPVTRRNNPEAVVDAVKGQLGRGQDYVRGVQLEGNMLLSDLMPEGDDRFKVAREEIIKSGKHTVRNGAGKGNTLAMQLRPIQKDGKTDYEVMAMGAVARDPGLTQDYIDSIQDFLPTTDSNRSTLIQQLWQMYEVEPILNNAVNKLAAVLSAGGRWKARTAKKGKKQNALVELQSILDDTARFINFPGPDMAITNNVGLKAICQAAVRQALVEGDYFGRCTWSNKDIASAGLSANVPVNIQAITCAEIEAAKVFGTGLEAYYWRPSGSLVNEITSPTDKNVGKMLKKLIPSDVLSQLKKEQKYFLDQSLLIHVKHRGVDFKPYGQSFIAPAKIGVALSRAILAAEFVTLQNLINRLTIVMVGSADKASPYAKADVAQARTALMQTFFEESAPNMVIVWSGNDVDVKDVGAHQKALDTDGKHRTANEMIKMGLGMPDALLLGTSDSGKASGWASVIGAAAEMEELQNSFATAFTILGLRIAEQNGYIGVDLTWEFDKSLLVDRAEELNQTRNDYVIGGSSIRSFLLARGKDPDAERRLRAEERGLDPDDPNITWEQIFMPPQGLQGQGAPGAVPLNDQLSQPDGTPAAPPGQGPGKTPGNGRTPDSVQGKPSTKPTEKKTPNTNK